MRLKSPGAAEAGRSESQYEQGEEGRSASRARNRDQRQRRQGELRWYRPDLVQPIASRSPAGLRCPHEGRGPADQALGHGQCLVHGEPEPQQDGEQHVRRTSTRGDDVEAQVDERRRAHERRPRGRGHVRCRERQHGKQHRKRETERPGQVRGQVRRGFEADTEGEFPGTGDGAQELPRDLEIGRAHV